MTIIKCKNIMRINIINFNLKKSVINFNLNKSTINFNLKKSVINFNLKKSIINFNLKKVILFIVFIVLMSNLGYNIANQDNLVKSLLKKIIEKEEEYIVQYVRLKKLYPECKELTLKTEFEKILEVKRLNLEYKLQSKEKQHSALLKILEYLNNLEEKKANLDTQELLQKMSSLENEISKLQTAINS